MPKKPHVLSLRHMSPPSNPIEQTEDTTAPAPPAAVDGVGVRGRSDRRATGKVRGAAHTNPFIYSHKTVYMQRIGDAVRAGFSLYTSGSIKLSKLPFLLQKFAERYQVNGTRMQDHRAGQEKRDVGRFYSHHVEGEEMVSWILLYKPGRDPDSREKWRDAKADRIEYKGYELVRATKKEKATPAWTWRMTRQHYRTLHDEMVFAIRGKQDAVVEQIIYSTSKAPGFAGVREQVKGIWEILRSEWKRRRAKGEPVPKIPPTIGYVRRLADKGNFWSELVGEKKPGRT